MPAVQNHVTISKKNPAAWKAAIKNAIAKKPVRKIVVMLVQSTTK